MPLAYTCYKIFEESNEERLEVTKVEFGERRWLGNRNRVLTLYYPSSLSVELEKCLTEKGDIFFNNALINDGKDIQNIIYYENISSIKKTITFLAENKKISSNLSETVLKYLDEHESMSKQIEALVGGGPIVISRNF